MNAREQCDVLVIGGGNAALCAAIAARQAGASVTVLEKANKDNRGGNSSLTINLRFPYSLPDLLLLFNTADTTVLDDFRGRATYTNSDFYDDLMNCSGGQCESAKADVLAREAFPTMLWLTSLGHQWEITPKPIAGSVPLGMRGGGYGHQERSYAIALSLGVNIRYETTAVELLRTHGHHLLTVVAEPDAGKSLIASSSVVLACGGFEANPEMVKKFLGPEWVHARVRGVPFNTGDGITMAFELGARRAGDWSKCHATPVSATCPHTLLPREYLLSRRQWRYSFPFGVTVNQKAKRFFDEGETYRNLVYSKIGGQILHQQDNIAFQVFDSKAWNMELLDATCYAPDGGITAPSLGGIARALGLPVEQFIRTIDEFNSAIQQKRPIDPRILDNVSTVGLSPNKSNWSLPLDKPPFWAFPVRCGLTFTYGGLKTDTDGRVIGIDDKPISGLFAAGEIVGGLFFDNYPGGTGITAGAVFGRRAGTTAALHASAAKER